MKEKAIQALKRVKDKVVDVTSDVLSKPKRAYHESLSRGYNKKYEQIKTLREMKGVPDKGNESDPLFRARVNAIHDTFDREEAKRN